MGAPAAHDRLGPHPGIADRRGADQLVQGHLVGLGDRQQQLQARTALPGFEPRERAHRDAGRGGQLGQRHAALGAGAFQPRADFGEGLREVIHDSRN